MKSVGVLSTLGAPKYFIFTPWLPVPRGLNLVVFGNVSTDGAAQRSAHRYEFFSAFDLPNVWTVGFCSSSMVMLGS